eukprot:765339-Hanusia_phi.AAC.1
MIEPKPSARHVHFDQGTSVIIRDDVCEVDGEPEEAWKQQNTRQQRIEEELEEPPRDCKLVDNGCTQVESAENSSRVATLKGISKRRVRKKRFQAETSRLPTIYEETAEDVKEHNIIAELRSAFNYIRQTSWTRTKHRQRGVEGSESGATRSAEEISDSDREYEQVSSSDASWCCGAGEALREHDEKLEEMRRPWSDKFVEELEGEEESVRGPFSGGLRSLVLYICNTTAAPLVLAAHDNLQRCRWPMQPPAKIDPGKQSPHPPRRQRHLQSIGGQRPRTGPLTFSRPYPPLLSLLYSSASRADNQQLVWFTVQWQTAVGAWMKWSSSSARGWGVEREYRRGNRGRHVVTRFFFTRKFNPMSVGLRDLTL